MKIKQTTPIASWALLKTPDTCANGFDAQNHLTG